MTNNIQTIIAIINSWYAEIVNLMTDLMSNQCDSRIFEKVRRVVPIGNLTPDDLEDIDDKFRDICQELESYTNDDMTISFHRGMISLEPFRDYGYGDISLFKSLEFDRDIFEDMYYVDEKSLTIELGFRFVYEYVLDGINYRDRNYISERDYSRLRSMLIDEKPIT